MYIFVLNGDKLVYSFTNHVLSILKHSTWMRPGPANHVCSLFQAPELRPPVFLPNT